MNQNNYTLRVSSFILNYSKLFKTIIHLFYSKSQIAERVKLQSKDASNREKTKRFLTV